jgi:hypothetical protein
MLSNMNSKDSSLSQETALHMFKGLDFVVGFKT